MAVAFAAVASPFLPAASDLQLQDASGTLRVRAVAPDILRLDYVPAGATVDPTEILDPAGRLRFASVGSTNGTTLSTAVLRVVVTAAEIQVRSASADGTTLVIDRVAAARGVLLVRLPG